MPSVCRIGDPITCGDKMAEGSGDVHTNFIPTSRKNKDKTVGHCFQPTILQNIPETVWVNNLPISHVGAPIVPHVCPPIPAIHGGRLAAGSPNVFVYEAGGATPVITPEEAQVIAHMDQFKQPGISIVEAAETHVDDGEEEPIHRQYKEAAYNATGTTTPPETVAETDSTPPPAAPPGISAECEDLQSYPGSYQLSPNFTLSQVTTNTIVSNYSLRAQAGFTVQQIVCNLKLLCINILEPLLAAYPDMRINSGFRHGQRRSQHFKGQAVDVSFPSAADNNSAYVRAKEIRDNFTYDQFIYEAQNTIWFHLSYNPDGSQRRMVGTMLRSERKPYFGSLRKIT